MRSTAQLGRRPLTRQISATTTTSAGGSCRFSRSSNPNALAGIPTRFNGFRPTNVDSSTPESNGHPLAYNQRHSIPEVEDNVRAIGDLSPTMKPPHPAADGPYKGISRERREMFTFKLSIPTTINEESTSRTFNSPSCEKLSTIRLASETEERQPSNSLSTSSAQTNNTLEAVEHKDKKKKKRKRLNSAEDNSISDSQNSSGRFRSLSSGDSTNMVCSCSTCRSTALQARAASITPASSSSDMAARDVETDAPLTSGRTTSSEDEVYSSNEVKPLLVRPPVVAVNYLGPLQC